MSKTPIEEIVRGFQAAKYFQNLSKAEATIMLVDTLQSLPHAEALSVLKLLEEKVEEARKANAIIGCDVQGNQTTFGITQLDPMQSAKAVQDALDAYKKEEEKKEKTYSLTFEDAHILTEACHKVDHIWHEHGINRFHQEVDKQLPGLLVKMNPELLNLFYNQPEHQSRKPKTQR